MKWQRLHREDPEIGMTPLIDVVFLLLIFFMVSTTFKEDSEITIDLPQASARPLKEQQAPLRLTINAEGHYALNDRRLVNDAPDTLGKALDRIMATMAKRPSGLVIRADGQASHQAVITAMDVARKAGLIHLSLSTRPLESRH